MYQSHWGLQASPFRALSDVRFFYKSPTHEEALARLHFLVDQHRRIGLLLGGPGVGKSLVLEVFAQALRRSGCQVVLVGLIGLNPHELLWQITAKLGANPGTEENVARLWRRLTDRLIENRLQQQTTVILFDDADAAPEAVLSNIVRLAQHNPSTDARLTLLLAADVKRLDRLGPRLLDLAALRIDLSVWDEAATAGYLQSALAKAGRLAPAFDDDAVVRLHKLSHGIPRQVNHLADLALLAGAGQELGLVDADTVEAVYGELSAH